MYFHLNKMLIIPAQQILKAKDSLIKLNFLIGLKINNHKKQQIDTVAMYTTTLIK